MRLSSLTVAGTLLFAATSALPARAQTATSDNKSWETCISVTGTGATRLPACTDVIENKLVEGRKMAGALCIRGNDLTEKGELDAALVDLNRAIEIDPTYACAFVNRGRAYKFKGDVDRAIADYSEAIRLDPKMVLAWNNRGDAYLAKKDPDRAIADLDMAIKIAPNYALAYRNRGDAYARKKD
ncbi:MAG: tetratricopeptide repeat protein, partial [Alphaproteobacteria bacterium]|nr:tetratricopeptide repeat protein [Alphaproteobacteria bacterium]